MEKILPMTINGKSECRFYVSTKTAMDDITTWLEGFAEDHSWCQYLMLRYPRTGLIVVQAERVERGSIYGGSVFSRVVV